MLSACQILPKKQESHRLIGPSNQSYLEPFNHFISNRLYSNLVALGFAMVTTGSILPYIFPAMLAFVIVTSLIIHFFFHFFCVDWVKLLRTFRPLLMQKVDGSDLNQATKKTFESETPTLLSRGFHLLGDYKLKGDPLVIHSRIFLAPKLNYFVAIMSLSNDQAFELIGYLEDGTVIETAATTAGEPLPTQDLLDSKNYFIEGHHKDMNLTELLQDHEARMQAHSQVAESSIQVIPKLDWVEFFKYHNRRSGQILFEAGKLDNKPEGVVTYPSTRYAPANVNSANKLSAV